jgi:hypothetical protein
MTSLNGPKGDTHHRPTTTRCPVVVPKAAISPSKRQRKVGPDLSGQRDVIDLMIPAQTGADEPSVIAPQGDERRVASLNGVNQLGGVRVISTIEVVDQGNALAYTFEDLMRYHGPGSPGGVAHGLKVMERVLPLLEPGGVPERREIRVETAFAGPGARDAFEMVTRAVTEGRYVIDDALARAEQGPTRERFVFRLGYRRRSVTVLLREGYVTEEFIALARMPERTGDQESRLTVLKREMAELLLATPAAEVYDVAGEI